MNQTGGEKKKKTTKTSSSKKTTKSTKPSSKKTSSSKSTKTRSKKGGNFLGSVGELVAPNGWESFATMAGLFAIDRADAAFRRGTKKEKMKGGKNMKGGQCDTMPKVQSDSMILVERPTVNKNSNNLQRYNTLKGNAIDNPKYILGDNNFIGKITCDSNYFYVNIEIYCGVPLSTIEYKLPEKFNSFDEAKNWLKQRKNQIALINLALLNNHQACRNPDYKSPFNLKKNYTKS
jgi:hypothetical protein